MRKKRNNLDAPGTQRMTDAELSKKLGSYQKMEYIDSVLGNLKGQLDNTYIVDEQGNKTKLQKKGEK